MVTTIRTAGTLPGRFENYTCHRDKRGIITHATFEVDGIPYMSFPGDFPPAEAPEGMRDVMYIVSNYEDGGGDSETRTKLYGKRADSYVTEPVIKIVIDGNGAIVEWEPRTEWVGNPACWGVAPEARGTLIGDDIL